MFRLFTVLALAALLGACGGGSPGEAPTAQQRAAEVAAILKDVATPKSLAWVPVDGARSEFQIVPASGSTALKDVATGDSRSYTQPTALAFSDIAVAIQASESNAGRIYRLYKLFDRAPDATGLGGWLDQMERGTTLEAIAAAFTGSDEFRIHYGTNPSPETLVTLLYRKVLNREPTASEVNGWAENYRNGVITLVQMVLGFTQSDENKAKLLPAIQAGIPFVVFDTRAFQASGPAVLVLYDAPLGTSSERLGLAYAIMLRNLLGHFDAKVQVLPVQQYTAGKMAGYGATFYLGVEYNHPLPAAFLADAAATRKPLVWFRYNLWKLAWDPAYRFTETKGITFHGLRGLNAAPSAADPAPGFFDTINYKGRNFAKFYEWNGATGAISADPDVGAVAISDPSRARNLMNVYNSRTGEALPYVSRAGNFWYVADLPFSFIGPRDRYLVIADLLHDMLNIQHPEQHQALVRLEDVGAMVSVQTIKDLSNYLSASGVPFSIATIPLYKDPLGAYNDGTPETVTMAQATNLKTSLNYAIARGAEIVMHGYSHQYGSQKNPWTGVSGDDYEFWNIVTNTPVAEDSQEWAAQRVNAGLADLRNAGYTPIAWEAPHYHSSPAAARAAAAIFPTGFQRVVYFTSEKPDLKGTPRDYDAGQFFPFLVQQDHYGQRIVPENLGNIEYDIRDQDPSSTYNYTSQDIVTNAEYALTVRDSYASFFFHPFWLEPDLGTPGMADFRKTVEGITRLGYTWTRASQAK